MKFKKMSFFIIIFCLISSALYSQADRNFEPYDPFETINRKTHYFNKTLDKNALRPASYFYGSYVPSIIRIPITNFRNNLSEPKRFINHVFQRSFGDAGTDLSRFVINSTIGLAGLIDVATLWEIYPKPTNFDDSFASFSVPMGPFVELPLFGPNSGRSTFGLIADYSLNPAKVITTGIDSMVLIGVEAANLFQKRYEYGTMIDSTLYNSADSYLASRNIFMQTKEEFDIDDFEADIFDPYAEE